jgi:lysine-N-methylase
MDACPDTCCQGWRVGVDKTTFDKYQTCSDPELSAPLQNLVTINPASVSNDTFATITTIGARCPFLSEGLCSIQMRLGEKNLSNMCASYPRVSNIIDGVLERTLDLSCPEAARVALTDPAPLEFFPTDGQLPAGISRSQQEAEIRLANVSVVDSATSPEYRHLLEIRDAVLSILQNRRYAIGERLVLVGHVCDKLNELASQRAFDKVHQVLEGFSVAIASGLFDDHLSRLLAPATRQLEVVLELILARIGSDYTPPKFLNLYQQFMDGLNWTAESSIDDIGCRYHEAFKQSYSPFIEKHQYLLENYLVNNVYRTLFPFGSQSMKKQLGLHGNENEILTQYLLLSSYYAIVRTLLIGLSAYHGDDFGTTHVVEAVQACSKIFEHSVSFPLKVLGILADNSINTAAGMVLLIN